MPVVSLKAITLRGAEVTAPVASAAAGLEVVPLVKRTVSFMVGAILIRLLLLLLLEVPLLWPAFLVIVVFLVIAVEVVLMALIAAWVSVHLLKGRKHMVFRVLFYENLASVQDRLTHSRNCAFHVSPAPVLNHSITQKESSISNQKQDT